MKRGGLPAARLAYNDQGVPYSVEYDDVYLIAYRQDFAGMRNPAPAHVRYVQQAYYPGAEIHESAEVGDVPHDAAHYRALN